MTDTVTISLEKLAHMVLADEYPDEYPDGDHCSWYHSVVKDLVAYAKSNPEDVYGSYQESVNMFWNLEKMRYTNSGAETTVLNLGDLVEVFVSQAKINKLAQTEVSTGFLKVLRKRFMDCLRQNPIPESQWDELLECCFSMEKLMTPLNCKTDVVDTPVKKSEDSDKPKVRDECKVPDVGPNNLKGLIEGVSSLLASANIKPLTNTSETVTTIADILKTFVPLSTNVESSVSKSGEPTVCKSGRPIVQGLASESDKNQGCLGPSIFKGCPRPTGISTCDCHPQSSSMLAKLKDDNNKAEPDDKCKNDSNQDWEKNFREEYTKLCQRMQTEKMSNEAITLCFDKLKPKTTSISEMLNFTTKAMQIMSEIDKQYPSKKNNQHKIRYKCTDCDKVHTKHCNIERLFPLTEKNEGVSYSIVTTLKDVLHGYDISLIPGEYIFGGLKPTSGESVDKDYSDLRQFTRVNTLHRMAAQRDYRFSSFTTEKFASFLEEAGCCLFFDTEGLLVANLVPSTVKYASGQKL